MASLQDANALHLLLEFCPGGELLRLLQQSPLGVPYPYPYPYPYP